MARKASKGTGRTVKTARLGRGDTIEPQRTKPRVIAVHNIWLAGPKGNVGECPNNIRRKEMLTIIGDTGFEQVPHVMHATLAADFLGVWLSPDQWEAVFSRPPSERIAVLAEFDGTKPLVDLLAGVRREFPDVKGRVDSAEWSEGRCRIPGARLSGWEAGIGRIARKVHETTDNEKQRSDADDVLGSLRELEAAKNGRDMEAAISAAFDAGRNFAWMKLRPFEELTLDAKLVSDGGANGGREKRAFKTEGQKAECIRRMDECMAEGRSADDASRMVAKVMRGELRRPTLSYKTVLRVWQSRIS